jgi:hypothetical protein
VQHIASVCHIAMDAMWLSRTRPAGIRKADETPAGAIRAVFSGSVWVALAYTAKRAYGRRKTFSRARF